MEFDPDFKTKLPLTIDVSYPTLQNIYLIVRDDEVDGLIHDDGHKSEDEGFVDVEESPNAHTQWLDGPLKFSKYVPAVSSRFTLILSP